MRVLRETSKVFRDNRRLLIGGLLWIGLTQLFAAVDFSKSPLVLRTYAYCYRLIAPTLYAGDSHQCNLCGRKIRTFRLVQGVGEWACPFCSSRPRHRTTWKYFRDKTDLFDGRPKRFLHVAPEFSMGSRLENIDYLDYLSGD